MLAPRIIPVMLCKGPMLVKGTAFNPWRIVGSLENAVRVHAKRGVDELLLLDVTARSQGKLFDLDMLERITTEVFVPLTVGGGINCLDDARELLLHGADKVAMSIHAYQCIRPISARFGSQAVVAMVDYGPDGMVRSKDTMVDALSYCQMVERAGAGEIVLQSKVRDGTQMGYDFSMLQRVVTEVGIPVVMAGGCGGAHDMMGAIRLGASGAAAGALFQFTSWTPKEVAEYLLREGIEVRT